jgi:hypothetical protein
LIAALDPFTVPTLTFRVLYGFFVIEHHRRRVLHFSTPARPTGDWISIRLNVRVLLLTFAIACSAGVISGFTPALHRSRTELERAIYKWLENWNGSPTPFVWKASADVILDKVRRCCKELTSTRD